MNLLKLFVICNIQKRLHQVSKLYCVGGGKNTEERQAGDKMEVSFEDKSARGSAALWVAMGGIGVAWCY